jgi:iron complex outermembrane receptor protein
LTPLRFSPRGSLVYTPVNEHTFRASAGTAYRNPTLLENYFTYPTTVPAPVTFFPFTSVDVRVQGERTLMPETIESMELSHSGKFRRVKTTLTGFRSRYKNAIALGDQIVTFPPPVVTQSFDNIDDPLTVWGYQAEANVLATSWLSLFANYTYQMLRQESGADSFPAVNTPRHKANWGARAQRGGFHTQWTVNWVDKTVFGTAAAPQPVNAYFLVNAAAGYAFRGRWDGLEVGVSAFNLLNHSHYEFGPILPNATTTGLESGIVRSRLLGTVSYKF